MVEKDAGGVGASTVPKQPKQTEQPVKPSASGNWITDDYMDPNTGAPANQPKQIKQPVTPDPVQPTPVVQPTGNGGGYSGGGYYGGSGVGGSQVTGGTSSGDAAEGETPEAPSNIPNVMDTAGAASTTQRIVEALRGAGVEVGKLDHIDTADLENKLQQIRDVSEQQANAQVDFATQQGVTELERAKEDAQQQFQTQRNQIAADEQKALDNQALYAQARGDNGGLGMAQYNEIQNNAATNRMTVNNAQTKLSTDTARQIADLRAQGEFKKADNLLALTQSYLSDLMSLEQYALSTNLSIDQFNTQIDQWVAQFNQAAKEQELQAELNAAQLTGAFSDGTTTMAAQKYINEALAAAGETAISMGLTPTPEQIEAMGLSAQQWKEYEDKKNASSGGGWYGGNITPGNTVIYYDANGNEVGRQTVKEAQAGSGASVDGIVGPETTAAINAGLSAAGNNWTWKVT